VALILEYDQQEKKLCIDGYTKAKNEKFTRQEKRNVYLAEAMKCAKLPDNEREKVYFLTMQ
jgi:hypothetical protein